MNKTSYSEVSTAELGHRRNNVEMLWLDVIERKLQAELAELQNTPIDELHRTIETLRDAVAAQNKVLHDCHVVDTENTQLIDDLKNTIEGLEDKNIEDLKELYGIYQQEIADLKAELREKTARNTSLIEQYHLDRKSLERVDNVVNDLKAEIKRLREAHHGLDKHNDDLLAIIRDKNEIIDKTKKDRDEWKQSSRDGSFVIRRDSMKTKAIIDDLRNTIEGLEAELSAKEGDSEVLNEVVKIVTNELFDDAEAMYLVTEIINNYVDAPDQPEEEENRITVKVAWLELP